MRASVSSEDVVDVMAAAVGMFSDETSKAASALCTIVFVAVSTRTCIKLLLV